ncbi:MAG: ABC transporter permease [Aquificaceae bacterium]
MTFRRLSISFAISIFVLYAGLVISLFYFWKGSLFVETLLSERTLFSIKLSLITATVTTLLSLIIALPSAYALSRFDFKGKHIIDTTLELPMIVSPAALGAMLLIFFSTSVGMWIQDNFVPFVFSPYGIILAQFITTVGIATRLVKSAMDEIPQRYEDVAISLGVSPFKAFLTITLPLSIKGILAASILTWAKAIGEFGATIMLAGTMAMKTETLPIAIFMRLSMADIEGTVTLIIVLITIGITTLYSVRLLTRRALNR